MHLPRIRSSSVALHQSEHLDKLTAVNAFGCGLARLSLEASRSPEGAGTIIGGVMKILMALTSHDRLGTPARRPASGWRPAPAELRCEAPLSAPLVPLYLSDGNRGCLNPFHGNPRGRRRPSGFAVDSPQEGAVRCELVSAAGSDSAPYEFLESIKKEGPQPSDALPPFSCNQN